MKVFELAKLTGKSSKELANELGVKSHLSLVPEDLLGSYLQKDAEVETKSEVEKEPLLPKIVLAPKVEEKKEEIEDKACPVDLKTLELSIRCRGGKSPYWKYRDLLNG